MSWYKVTLPREKNLSGEPLAEILNGLAAIMDANPVPSGVALFTQKQMGGDYSYTVYFSPACAAYCPEFLKQVHAVESDKPDKSDVGWLLGHPDASSLIDR